MPMIEIRPEERADHDAVHRVVALAFPSNAEALLVDALRTDATPNLSLVALSDQKIVGHVFFSPVTVRAPGGESSAFGLAPLAVLPNHQNRGIGAELTRAGLDACAAIGELVVFVLGHVNYYPRFGFQRADGFGLYFGKPGPNPAFMVAELREGALGDRTGEVRYAPAFYSM